MESNEPTAEDLSETSESNSSSSSAESCRSEPLTSFQPYRRINDNNCKPEDESISVVTATRYADGNDQPIALDKPKDYAVHRNEAYSESSSTEEASISVFRTTDHHHQNHPHNLSGPKDAMYSFCREIREMRQKNLHAALERNNSVNNLTTSTTNPKDFELSKNYSLQLDRNTKDFNFTSRLQAFDRLRSTPIHHQQQQLQTQQSNRPTSPRTSSVRYPLEERSLELCITGETTPINSTSNLDQQNEEIKVLTQSRSGNPIEASVAFERLRHSHPGMFQSNPDFSPTQATHHHPHPHHHHHHHHTITQLTQMQQQQSSGTQQPQPSSHHHLLQQQQQQQQHLQHQPHPQQTKSFTIDAILGLRASSQRDKHPRYHPYKKQQGQEQPAKNVSNVSCTNGGTSDNITPRPGGKLKRVRTIFTAEQLERLEDEFSRQQYMVGPERLYLAHALRLTEAQVKVWFQNRRIKWRKHDHERTSQQLLIHQRSVAEREDSNENTPEW